MGEVSKRHISLDAIKRELFNDALPNDRVGGLLTLDQERWLVEQLEATEKLVAAAIEDLDRIADWPHVKLYGGHETAYMPLIVHEWARAARQHFREASNPASEPQP